MCDLIVDVLQKCKGGPPTDLHDRGIVDALQFESHGASRPERMCAYEVGVDAVRRQT